MKYVQNHTVKKQNERICIGKSTRHSRTFRPCLDDAYMSKTIIKRTKNYDSPKYITPLVVTRRKGEEL